MELENRFIDITDIGEDFYEMNIINLITMGDFQNPEY